MNPDPTNEGDTRMETKDWIVTGNMKVEIMMTDIYKNHTLEVRSFIVVC